MMSGMYKEKLVFVPRTLVITILLQQSPSFSKIRNFT